MSRNLIGSFLVVSITLGAALATNSFFSDTETSAGNNFTAGSFDLLVNGQNNPQSIVSFGDLKPGDNYIEHKTIRINDNPGFVWLHLKDLAADQGTQTEPETIEENGTPKFDLQNYLEYDLTVGEQVLISADSHTPLPDAVSCWIPLGEIQGGADISLDQSFHLPGSVTNWAQGDTLTFTEEFYAVQSRTNPHASPPPSTTGRIWNPELKKCVSAEPVLVDTVTVPSTSDTPTLSHITLAADKIYRFDVSGTYIYWPSCPEFAPCDADAEFAHRPSTSYGPGWILGDDVYPPAITHALDLTINGVNINWGVYSPAHTYSTTLPGTGSAAGFSIYDDYYPDNSGNLTVNIYQLP